MSDLNKYVLLSAPGQSADRVVLPDIDHTEGKKLKKILKDVEVNTGDEADGMIPHFLAVSGSPSAITFPPISIMQPIKFRNLVGQDYDELVRQGHPASHWFTDLVIVSLRVFRGNGSRELMAGRKAMRAGMKLGLGSRHLNQDWNQHDLETTAREWLGEGN